MTRLHSLRWRLMAAMLIVFGLGLGASALFSYGEAYGTLKELRKRTLQGQARELLAALRFKGDGSVEVALPPEWTNAYQRPDRSFAYSVYNANQRVVALSPNIHTPLPLVGAADSDPVKILGPERLAVLAVAAPEGHTVVVARGHPDQEALAESLIEENYEHLFVVVPFILISLPLLWQISRWSLRPLARASREAQAIGPADLSARLSVEGLPDEVRPLVDAVNGALERLAHAYESERRLTADAAHQLRTPITILDLRLQRARHGGRIDWPTIECEMAQLRHLIDRLMDLARRDSIAHTADAAGLQTVNLARIVREAAAMVLPIAEKEGRSVIVEAPDLIQFHGRADDLRDMVANLLDNALVHGCGTVRVALRRERSDRGQDVVVEVIDEGMGVPDELKEAMFERFRKVKQTSAGAGLGLAIVRQVARGHAGEASFLSEAVCGVKVVLPADFDNQIRLQSAAE